MFKCYPLPTTLSRFRPKIWQYYPFLFYACLSASVCSLMPNNIELQAGFLLLLVGNRGDATPRLLPSSTTRDMRRSAFPTSVAQPIHSECHTTCLSPRPPNIFYSCPQLYRRDIQLHMIAPGRVPPTQTSSQVPNTRISYPKEGGRGRGSASRCRL